MKNGDYYMKELFLTKRVRCVSVRVNYLMYMHRVIGVCDAYYDVKFNSSKSQLLVYNPPINIHNIKLSGHEPGAMGFICIGKWCTCTQDTKLVMTAMCLQSTKGVRYLVYRTNFVMYIFNAWHVILSQDHTCFKLTALVTMGVLCGD